jgi:hypothetical protein
MPKTKSSSGKKERLRLGIDASSKMHCLGRETTSIPSKNGSCSKTSVSQKNEGASYSIHYLPTIISPHSSVLVKLATPIQHNGYLRRPSSIDGRTVHPLGSGAQGKLDLARRFCLRVRLAMYLRRKAGLAKLSRSFSLISMTRGHYVWKLSYDQSSGSHSTQ